ncbi:MAG: hypothetical protein WCF49_14845, partial [Xanthobacteraceae bacterium]
INNASERLDLIGWDGAVDGWMARLPPNRRGTSRLGAGRVKTPARFHTDLFRSLFRALRPSRDEEIMEIFAPRGRSENFAEF